MVTNVRIRAALNTTHIQLMTRICVTDTNKSVRKHSETESYQRDHRTERCILLYLQSAKGKVFICSLPSIGPGADPGVSQPTVTFYFLSHPSAVGCHYFLQGQVTFPATSTSFNQYQVILLGDIGIYRCEQLAQSCYRTERTQNLAIKTFSRQYNRLHINITSHHM